MNITSFKSLPIVGILRGIQAQDVEPLTEAIVSAGLKTIEITMNTEGAPALIRRMVKAAGGRLTIGAGTVLTLDDLKTALDAGATFVVSPILNRELVEQCIRNSVPVFPGALTPQEIYEAWAAGASMVKVFPAKFFGPSYFREIKAPLEKIELLACGGVNADNIKEFFACGASAVAFGASIFKKQWMQEKKFDLIGKEIGKLIAEWKA